MPNAAFKPPGTPAHAGASLQALWWRRVLLCAALVLAGCSSQTRQVASNLDMRQAAYQSRECQMALGQVARQDTIRHSRALATPLALLVGGAPWLLPLLVVNAGLDTVDHLEASDLSVYCGGPEKPNGQIAREVMLGVGFGLGLSK